ncbi:MAG TPA: AEC family transporter [Azospirillaceae bacterium]|nr:AEC family transporter [Azospirillaceae bacterium]
MAPLLEIVLPAFGLVLAGFALCRPPLFGPGAAEALGTFNFTVALPCLLFRSMARQGMPGPDELAILGAYYTALLAACALAFAAARALFREDTPGATVLTLGSSFSNTVLVGVPLVLAAFGPEGLRQLLLIITFHALVLLGGGTVLIEAGRARGQGRGLAALAGGTALALLRNPVVTSIAAGLVFAATGLALPKPVDRLLELAGSSAVPCSLFALGASLVGLKVGHALGRTGLMVGAKLVLLPLLVWLSGRYVFDLPPLQLGVAVTCASLPAGFNVFLLAQRYGLHTAPVAGAIVVSTALSALTTGLVIALFRV